MGECDFAGFQKNTYPSKLKNFPYLPTVKTPIHIHLRLFILAVLLCNTLTVSAQKNDWAVKVRTVTPDDGLSSRFVAQIYQDTEDYLWFVTSEGLNRYDGYHMDVYNTRRMGGQIVFPYIVLEDCARNMWLVSYSSHLNPSGPVRFNWRLEVLDPYNKSIVSGEDNLPFPIEELSWIGQIPGQLILFGTEHGKVFAYDGSFSLLYSDPENRPVSHLLGAGPDNIYLVSGHTLRMIDASGVEKGQLELPAGLQDLQVNQQGELWGLFAPSLSNRRLIHLEPERGEMKEWALPADQGFQSNRQILWKVTSEGEIILHRAGFLGLYDRNGRIRADFSKELAKSHPGFFFNRLYLDHMGTLWGTMDSGLMNMSFHLTPFRPLLHNPPISIRGMEWMNDSVLVVANYRQTLLLNVRTGKYRFAGSEPLVGMGICRDTFGYWWMGGHIDYFVRYSPDFRSNRRYPLFPPPSRMPRRTADANVPYLDKYGTVWLGTTKGLAVFDPAADELVFPPFSGPFSHLKEKEIHCFLETGEGLWVGTSGGLYLLQYDGTIQAFVEPLQRFYIYSIFRDSNGRFWLATRGDGLVFYDPETGEVRLFDSGNGFLSDVIYAILEDSHRMLWLSTNKGLIRFDPREGESAFFRSGDGLANEEFNYLAFAQHPANGWIYLGGTKGITAFHPDSVGNFRPLEAPLRITSFLEWVPESGAIQDHTRKVREEGRITLNPPVQAFQLSFALLNFQDPNYIQYAYWMEGLESSWVFLEEPTLRLSRIPPGPYILHINGRGENGQWSKMELRIPIWVAKPLYLRPAFWLACGIVLVVVSFLYYQFHLWQLKSRKNWLEQEVNRRTQDLLESQRLVSQQYRELEKLNRTKDQLFLILAHELKNPVLSFRSISQKINYLLRRKEMDRLKQLGDTLDRTASDAHNLLDNLLHWGKTQQGAFAMHPRIIYVLETFTQVMERYSGRVEEKGIQLITCLDDEMIAVWADPTAFQVMLRNLLDNAVKFTRSKGTICLCAHEQEDGSILVEVKDTGIGMKPEAQKTLFQPRDTPSVGTAGERGSGLGLLLVRELMDLHGGQLQIQSEYENGSTFGLWFPAKQKGND